MKRLSEVADFQCGCLVSLLIQNADERCYYERVHSGGCERRTLTV